uniref:Uncharacterized protein n=1 Tax=Heterorhabditis bacteriophora TaxID=37862 RepID=A0A1I7W6R6_HETBA
MDLMWMESKFKPGSSGPDNSHSGDPELLSNTFLLALHVLVHEVFESIQQSRNGGSE